MKKIFFCVLTGLLTVLFSCKSEDNVEENNKIESYYEKAINKIPQNQIEIIEIDGCEYILYKSTSGTNNSRVGFSFMTHKGNCKNPVHCYNKILPKTDTINEVKETQQVNTLNKNQ